MEIFEMIVYMILELLELLIESIRDIVENVINAVKLLIEAFVETRKQKREGNRIRAGSRSGYESMRYCDHCGTSNEFDAIFCKNCGEKLRSTSGEGHPEFVSMRCRAYGESVAHLGPILPQLMIITVWGALLAGLIPACGVNLDDSGTNGTQLLYLAILIIGAVVLPSLLSYHPSSVPVAYTILWTVILAAALFPRTKVNLDVAGFNAYQLLLFVEIICSAVILYRTFKKRKKYYE